MLVVGGFLTKEPRAQLARGIGGHLVTRFAQLTERFGSGTPSPESTALEGKNPWARSNGTLWFNGGLMVV